MYSRKHCTNARGDGRPKALPKVPTLGTGKTDYKVLRALIADGK